MAGKGSGIELAESGSPGARALRQLLLWGSLVRFSHTIFALPFALSMVVYLSRFHSISAAQLCWLIGALVSARTSAMSFNRYVDRVIDGRNPRTAGRELPAGKVSAGSVILLCGLSAALFFFSAAMLGRHCLILAPAVLLVLLGYSLTKRFTSGAHFVLGLALACAPGGVWYALTAEFAWLPVWMMLGVLMWVAGFDILYSLQDHQFDRSQGLFSLPSRVGVRGAVWGSRVAHLFSTLFFVIFAIQAQLGIWSWIGLLLFSCALFSQHLKISADRPDQIEATFFTRNAWASVVYLAGMVLDRLVQGA